MCVWGDADCSAANICKLSRLISFLSGQLKIHDRSQRLRRTETSYDFVYIKQDSKVKYNMMKLVYP